LISFRHRFGTVPSRTPRLTMRATHDVYRPWFAASAHGHSASISAWIAQRASSQSTCCASARPGDDDNANDNPMVRLATFAPVMNRMTTVPRLPRPRDGAICSLTTWTGCHQAVRRAIRKNTFVQARAVDYACGAASVIAMTPAHLADRPSHLRHIVLVVGNARDGDAEIVTTLLRAGFDALAVESGAATLALMDGGAAPCVLLIDADELPDMGALRLWDAVRARAEASRPASFLLSYDPIDPATTRGVDVECFLRKPVMPDRLVETVERYCPRRLFPKFTSADER
jgi:CheY-like chemotaxis protein